MGVQQLVASLQDTRFFMSTRTYVRYSGRKSLQLRKDVPYKEGLSDIRLTLGHCYRTEEANYILPHLRKLRSIIGKWMLSNDMDLWL